MCRTEKHDFGVTEVLIPDDVSVQSFIVHLCLVYPERQHSPTVLYDGALQSKSQTGAHSGLGSPQFEMFWLLHNI